MQILYCSLHNLDLNSDEPLKKDISVDFGNFIENYISETLASTTSREYTPRDYQRTTASCISGIFLEALRQGEILSEQDRANSFADSIARKLLDTEKSSQEQVRGITTIQNGSIVQSLVHGVDGYIYIIAKVEHQQWYDIETFARRFGIPGEGADIWKSAVVKLDYIDDSVVFTSIRCFVNTHAVYWTRDFLEIQEATSDSTNTRAVMKAFDKVLSPLKRTAPIDYYNLKNTVNHELQSVQMINYPEMVGRLLDNYVPNSDTLDTKALKEKLLALTEEKKFDTQFHSDPKEIKKLIRIKIPVSASVDVLIKDPQEDWKANFLIRKRPDGKKYLMIRCDDPKTLQSFPEDE